MYFATVSLSINFSSLMQIFHLFLLKLSRKLSNTLIHYTPLKSSFFRSVFNYFLLSLAISDLMSAVVSPLYLYRVTVGFSEWKLPTFLCPVITVLISKNVNTIINNCSKWKLLASPVNDLTTYVEYVDEINLKKVFFFR